MLTQTHRAHTVEVCQLFVQPTFIYVRTMMCQANLLRECRKLLAMEYCGSQPDLKFVLRKHGACSNFQMFSGFWKPCSCDKSWGKSCRPWTCARIRSSRPCWRTGTAGLVIPYNELDSRLMLIASRSLIGLVAHSLGEWPWLLLVHMVEVVCHSSGPGLQSLSAVEQPVFGETFRVSNSF